MPVRAKTKSRRLKKLQKRVEKEVYIFPGKRDYPLNRLVKKVKHQKPKTFKQQMAEWKEFQEMTE